MPRTRAVAYVRVSTEQQAEHGVSLEAQQEKLKAYAALYELDLVDVVVDAGASAATLDRPGLKRALRMLKTGAADALLVVKLDRLTRSVRDLGVLVERFFAGSRWALLSVGEQIDTRTAAGRLVLNVLASVAQWEREAIGERTSTALQHKAAKGEFVGGTPAYGSRVGAGGRLEPDEAEQSVIAAARGFRAKGMSLRQVARELDAMGHRSRSGRIFAPAQLARMTEAG